MRIYRSPHRAVDIPDTPLAEFVLERAARRGNRAALIDSVTGSTITYAQLPGLVDRAAASLARRGLAKGDVCGIFSTNTPEYAIAVLALARLGAVVTTTSAMCTRDDLVNQLRDARAKCLFTSPALGDIALDAASALKVEQIFSFGRLTGATPFADLLTGPADPPEVTIDPHDLVALPYSSGTTGLPKGVMLSHRNLVANILQVHWSDHLRDGEDTLICFLPFFHIYGLVVIMLLGLWSGATRGVLILAPFLELEHRFQKHVAQGLAVGAVCSRAGRASRVSLLS